MHKSRTWLVRLLHNLPISVCVQLLSVRHNVNSTLAFYCVSMLNASGAVIRARSGITGPALALCSVWRSVVLPSRAIILSLDPPGPRAVCQGHSLFVHSYMLLRT
ncbi:hypothetical protein K438DRAFT_1980266 [Mycena galopus ATCC 62051]|nr:hypothetical protein K438DRAFT_1980266 [Mycena galopus ATCC 62051]